MNKDESYSDDSSKTLAKKEEKVKDIYDAIMVENYNGSRYQIVIGEAIFEMGLKESIIRAMGLVSKFTDTNA